MATPKTEGSAPTLNTYQAPPPSDSNELPPPSYEEGQTDDQAGHLIGPIDLVLSNHHVVPPSSPNNPNPQPMYELSRGVAVLSHATSTVSFSRLDHAVRQGIGGAPVVKERKKHLYDLESVHSSALIDRFAGHYGGNPSSSAKDGPAYWCKSASRQTMGDVGLKAKTKFTGSASGFQVLQVKRTSNDPSGPVFMSNNRRKETPAIFEIDWRRKEDVHVWSQDSGVEVAVDSISNSTRRLEVRKEVTQEQLDVLVAVWCLRIWHDSAAEQEKNKPHEGLAGVKRKIRLGLQS